MIKKFFLLFCLFLYSLFIAQKTFVIDDFSKLYYAELTIDKGFENEDFKKGTLKIFDKKNSKVVIELASEEFTIDIDSDGKVITTVKELPYGEQSIIISEDFNFDGIDDLAIMDGQNSCYHGPSYQIYIQNGLDLIYDADFTDLAQSYCGMFEVDHKNKSIYVMTKSGCCWHQYSTYKVGEFGPFVTKIVEEELSSDHLTFNITEENLVNNKFVTKKFQILFEDNDINLVYSLNFENGKKMELYRAFNFDDFLFYVFTDKDKKIELLYRDDFTFDTEKNILKFETEDAIYYISNYEILVKTNSKKIVLKSKASSSNGSLKSLKDLKLKNLKFQ